MADDEIAAGMQLLDEAGDHLALGVRIEIDHHIAQENDVELAQRGQGPVQVHLHEAGVALDLGGDHETALLAAHAFQAILAQVGIGQAARAVQPVQAAFGGGEDGGGNVRAGDAPRCVEAKGVGQHE